MRGLTVAALLLLLPGPVAAQETPAEIHGEETMRAARAAMHAGMGGQKHLMVMADRLELQSHEGNPLLLLDGQGSFGGDLHKLTLKAETEYLETGGFEEVELQVLYSRAISPYFDLQAGYRHDFEPAPFRDFLVLGVQGLAPYWFEVDAAAFLSDDGDLALRVEAEYEFFLTQRLVLQPRMELDVTAQKVPEVGLGSGLSTVTAGLRLRYEFRREIAPYLGVAWHRATGGTADFVRAAGESPGAVSAVLGVRLWY